MNPVLEVITAEDCGACKAFGAIFPSLAASIKDRCTIKHYVTKLKDFDYRKMPDSVVARYLFSFPTLAIIKNGQLVSIFNGKQEAGKWVQSTRDIRYDLPTIQNWIRQYIPAGIVPPVAPPRSPAQVAGVYTAPVTPACQRAQYLPYNATR